MRIRPFLHPIRGKNNIMQILRLTLAVIFAFTAFVFSELVPEIHPFSRIFLRFMITVWFGFMGYGLFPDIAKKVTLAVISLVNVLTAKVSTEITSQLLKLQTSPSFQAPFSHNAPIGGISLNHPVILDTSAIIDGRILDVARTGFLSGALLLPSFVLAELQQVADSADYIKRSRGRRGFEIIEELKKIKGIRVEVWDKEPVAKTVDDKILKLAKSLRGRIVTTDFNLNQVAQVNGVSVMNINDLANAVKTIAIPGEAISVKIIHLGKDSKQGVGYLNDGTMIVVEDGANLVGQTVKTEVSRVLQSSAGRMIFVKTSESPK